jgi:hypothetical protein
MSADAQPPAQPDTTATTTIVVPPAPSAVAGSPPQVTQVTAAIPASTPDITPVQIAAGLKFVVMVLLALGLHINQADQVTIIGASGFVCVVLIIADALIRRGRAKALSVLGSRGVQDALAWKPREPQP